jgi:hypothetical protein
MSRKHNNAVDQPSLLDARVSSAPCVPRTREKVKAWREGGWKSVTGTTCLLANHWFHPS